MPSVAASMTRARPASATRCAMILWSAVRSGSLKSTPAGTSSSVTLRASHVTKEPVVVSFPPFRLDVDEERLWRGPKQVPIRRKPFAILAYLVANPKRLVTHDELMKAVWGDVTVSESAIRTHLHELRQVLGEGLIETVIGRGYRFTGEPERATAIEPPIATAPEIVGRADELAV